jgi:hypothetical protein
MCCLFYDIFSNTYIRVSRKVSVINFSLNIIKVIMYSSIFVDSQKKRFWVSNKPCIHRVFHCHWRNGGLSKRL